MSALGKKGIREMAMQNIEKADYTAKSLQSKGFTVVNESAFFNEFVVELPRSLKKQTQNFLKQESLVDMI